jgi:hypothetical protein
MKLSSILTAVAATVAFAAQISPAHATFAPENHLWLLDDPNAVSNITEAQFNDIITSITEHYRPVITALGGRMKVNARWTSSTVNAYARQLLGTWEVNYYGGLARRPEITPDGFALVVCHELGHHLGGFPFTSSWAANEGQADYFAALTCARTIWKDQALENAKSRETVDAVAKGQCDSVWADEVDRDICYRTANASQAISNLLAALGNEPMPAFDTPDQTVVTETDDQHPAAQCRLDTYFAGAICAAKWDEKVIPGKSFPHTGLNQTEAEREASTYSCMRASGFEVGLRPACWFKSTL